MFLRFSKGEFCEAYKRTYLKAVFILQLEALYLRN